MGYTHHPPQFERKYDGTPAGFVVDVLEDARQREGVGLRWRFVQPEHVGQALRSGEIDIWPAGVSTPARRQEFHITSHWWRLKLMLVTRDVDSLAKMAGRRVGYTRDLEQQIRDGLPAVQPVTMSDHTRSFQAVCRGDTEGALMDRLLVDRLLLNRPAGCVDVPLRLVGVSDIGGLRLAIIARRDKANVAERLRNRIDEAMADGTLAEIALTYPGVSAASANFVTALVKAHQRNLLLRIGLVILGMLLLVSGWFIWMQRQQIKRRRQTEEQLRKMTAALQQFAYAAHHDLREPLRNIGVFTQLLQRQWGTGTQEQLEMYFRHITSGAERMQHLLDALRRYTEVSTILGAADSAVPASKALEEATANLEVAIAESGAKIESGALPTVVFLHAHLVQLFQNLIGNAIKYHGAEPPRIVIACHSEPAYFLFSVRDNGVGIAPEHREKVFEVFQRLHGREVSGSGVGLAICKRIVESRGGMIWVESEGAGQGSAFLFTIPKRGAMLRGKSQVDKRETPKGVTAEA